MPDDEENRERQAADRDVHQAGEHRIDGQDFAREIHLAHQVDVLDQALGALVEAVGEKLPGDDAGHQEHGVGNVRQVAAAQDLLHQDREYTSDQQGLDQDPEIAENACLLRALRSRRTSMYRISRHRATCARPGRARPRVGGPPASSWPPAVSAARVGVEALARVASASWPASRDLPTHALHFRAALPWRRRVGLPKRLPCPNHVGRRYPRSCGCGQGPRQAALDRLSVWARGHVRAAMSSSHTSRTAPSPPRR